MVFVFGVRLDFHDQWIHSDLILFQNIPLSVSASNLDNSCWQLFIQNFFYAFPPQFSKNGKKIRNFGTKWAIFKILPFAQFLSYKIFIIWKIHENQSRNPMQSSDLVLLYPKTHSGGFFWGSLHRERGQRAILAGRRSTKATSPPSEENLYPSLHGVPFAHNRSNHPQTVASRGIYSSRPARFCNYVALGIISISCCFSVCPKGWHSFSSWEKSFICSGVFLNSLKFYTSWCL